MPDQHHLDSEILSSYLAGEATPQDNAAIAQWIEADQTRKDWLRKVELLWAKVPPQQIPPFNPEKFRLKLGETRDSTRTPSANSNLSRRGHPQPYPARRHTPDFPTLRTGRWTSFAGIGAIAVLLVVSWFSGSNYRASNLAELTSTYTTARGERATVTLPDGSTVVLNVDSRLDVPSDFAAGTRTVHLTGEALFTVVHNGDAPFIVKAGNSTTKVLGTSFVVRHYEADTSTRIAVSEGKVMVEDSVLTANQQISSTQHGLSAITAVGSSPFTFAEGVMTLENTTLLEAIPILSRWYNVEIRIGDTLLDSKNITGEFAAGSIAELTQILEWTFDIKVVRNGGILTLFPK